MGQTESSQSSPRHPFFWISLLLAAIMIAATTFALVMLFHYGKSTRDFGWRAIAQDNYWIISEVDSNSLAYGKLQMGDRINAINDDEKAALVTIGTTSTLEPLEPLTLKLNSIKAGDNYRLRISRNNQQSEITLPLQIKYSSKYYRVSFIYLILTLVTTIVALMIGLLKPEQSISRLACVGLILNALLFLVMALYRVSEFFQGWQLYCYLAIFTVYPLNFVSGYLFYQQFPAEQSKSKIGKILKIVVCLYGGLIFIFSRAIDITIMGGSEIAIATFAQHIKLLQWLWQLRYGFELFCVIAICIIITDNYRSIKERDQRRRIRWVIYGSAFGLLPIMAARIFLIIVGYNRFFAGESVELFYDLLNLSIIFIPITLGYAIIKHRVFDINVVVRQSLQYLLAKNMLRAIITFPLLVLLYTIFVNRNRTIGEVIFHNSIFTILLVVASLGLKFQTQLTEWIDRKFFRAAYDQEKLLLGLIEEIKNIDSMAEISRLVSKKIEVALHPKSVMVFYRDTENAELMMGHSSTGIDAGYKLADDSPLLQKMKLHNNAAEISTIIDLPDAEKVWLKQLDVNFIVPMNGSDGRLMGLLLLGEKLSEEPYSNIDSKLLITIAGQMAVIYENVLLKGRVHQEEKIKREVLARFEDQHINLVKECPKCGRCYDSTEENCADDEKKLELSLPVERVVEGKYRLEKLLGKGGMGAVYRATDLRLGRDVAIKVLSGSMFGDQEALRRFEREARASAKLNHINIITVYDYGRLNGGAYLVMELVKGRTLRAHMNERGRLNPVLIAEWFNQIFEGVKMAHQANIIHRDLKPENIFVCDNEGKEILKILDFGIAKVKPTEEVTGDSLTMPGTMIGTLGYMPPEQLCGEAIDERSDIFALGVMVIEAFTGRKPFQGKTLGEMMIAVLRGSYRLEGSSPDIKILDDALQRCIAKSQAARFSSVAEMQAELIAILKNTGEYQVRKPSGRSESTTAIIKKP